MAKKLDPQTTTPAPKAGVVAPELSQAARDLAVAHPDVPLTLGGRTLLVREYRFIEGQRNAHLMQAFQGALYALIAKDSGVPTYPDIEQLLHAHVDDVRAMVALSAGVEPEWIDNLGDTDGDQLLMAWWSANAGFFIRRMLRRMAHESPAAAPARSAGARSTRH